MNEQRGPLAAAGGFSSPLRWRRVECI